MLGPRNARETGALPPQLTDQLGSRNTLSTAPDAQAGTPPLI